MTARPALLADVAAIARDAGKAILSHYASASVERMKADRSPLTVADRAAHDVICDALARLSSFPIISEESAVIDFAGRQSWETFWLVDPLDGTKEFLKQSGEFTVNIALITSGVPTLGVVYAPVLDTFYLASSESAPQVVREGVAQTIHVQVPAARPARVAVSRDHSTPAEQALLAELGVARIPLGSSLKFCIVAEGGADLYPRVGPTMEWDTAAAQCVVESAGGRVVDSSGQRLRYNKPDLRNPSVFTFGDPALFEEIGQPFARLA